MINQAILLFALRLLSALLLFGFLGVIAWLIYQDMRVAAAAAERQQRAHGHLRVVASADENPAVDTLYPLLSQTRIGRARSNTLVLDDSYVSGEHATLTRRGQQWWLEDLQSRNGTLLNELPLSEPAVVSAGDLITIGGTQLRIEL